MHKVATHLNLYIGVISFIRPNLETKRFTQPYKNLPNPTNPLPNPLIITRQEHSSHDAPNATILILLVPILFRQFPSSFLNPSLLPKTTLQKFLNHDEVL